MRSCASHALCRNGPGGRSDKATGPRRWWRGSGSGLMGMHRATSARPVPGRASWPASTHCPVRWTVSVGPSTSPGRQWWWGVAAPCSTCTSACTGGCSPAATSSPGEEPWEAALRESQEETGLVLTHPAGGPRLIHVDVHAAANGHTHLDLRYLLLAPDRDPRPHRARAPRPAGSAGTRPPPWPTTPSSVRCAPPGASPRPPSGPGRAARPRSSPGAVGEGRSAPAQWWRRR